MKYCIAPALALAFALPLAAPAAAQPQGLKLWRLDCGAIDIDNLAAFSDTGLYSGEKRSFVASCYLI